MNQLKSRFDSKQNDNTERVKLVDLELSEKNSLKVVNISKDIVKKIQSNNKFKSENLTDN